MRLLFENCNSLGLFTSNKKIKQINTQVKSLQADGIFGNKDQTNWRKVPKSKQFSDLFGAGKPRRGISAHNVNEDKYSCSPPGGTSGMLFGCLSTFVKEVGSGYTGLGRWVWIVVGEDEHHTRLVTA